MRAAQHRSTRRSDRRRPASAARRAAGRVAPLLVAPRASDVCFASTPDFTDSAYWMYRHLLASRTGLRFTWLIKDPAVADRIHADFRDSGCSEHHDLQVVPWQSLNGYRAFLRSRVVFHTHGLFSFSAPRRDRRVVSLWHGMPLKVIGHLDGSGLWANDVGGDVHIASSRLFRPIIAAAFGAHPQSVLITGLPKSDVLKGLVAPTSDRAAMAAALGLDPDRPILAWLPTHRQDTDSDRPVSFLDQVDPTLLEALADSCSSSGCQLVVKLHHLDALNEGDAGARSPGPLTSGPPATLLSSEEWERSGVQLYDFLAAADGLITDLSSALVDFLHTGRPIGILGYDESTYGRDMIVPVDHISTSTAVFALKEVAQIPTFVDRVANSEVIDLPPDDVAHWLNEDAGVLSSERIASEVGL